MMPYCLTYLLVEYDESTFDMQDFCTQLSLDFTQTQRFSADGYLELGRNEFYDIDVNVMLRQTLKDILGKEDVLRALKEKYHLSFTLERVPFLEANERIPLQKLSLDKDIIRFMYLCDVADDLDYHI